MKIQESYLGGHQNREAGSFQLYYKGSLTGDTGHYGTFGTDHDTSYQSQSVSKNTLSITSSANPNGYQISEADTVNPGNSAKVLGVEFGNNIYRPEYSYISGDVAKAYDDNVTEAVRSMLFLNLELDGYTNTPGAFIVFDQITTKEADSKKSFLLHSLYEPTVVNNKVITITNKESGYNGRLTDQILYVGTADKADDDYSVYMIGGSDGLSGITANPVVGRFSDMLVAQGGSTVLTEVPEMFGAEGFLMNRCVTEEVFQKAVSMINGFKQYFLRHNEVVYENPSPGNKAGGITTLEDKSCGCVQKGGSAPIVDVIGYGDAVTEKGLNMLYGPGNDLVSSTALTAAGAHMVLFTTGRGTPFGAPAPTMKISTNTPLAQKKSGWIDFNAGVVADGIKTLDDAAKDLMALVLEVASGKQTKTEEKGFREISIFKDGVVL